MIHYFSFLIITYFNVGLAVWNTILVPTSTVLPRRVVVLEKTPVTAYCKNNSTATWTKLVRGNYIPVHRRHHKQKYKIVFVKLLKKDSGVYFCRKQNDRFSNRPTPTLFKRSIIITVKKKPGYGQALPTRVEIKEGDSITLSCGSFTPVLWVGVHLPSMDCTRRGNSLLITNMRKEHSGRFLCRGIREEKTVFHDFSIVLVDVKEVWLP